MGPGSMFWLQLFSTDVTIEDKARSEEFNEEFHAWQIIISYSLFCFSHFMRKYFTYWVTSIIYEFVTVKDMIGIL